MAFFFLHDKEIFTSVELKKQYVTAPKESTNGCFASANLLADSISPFVERNTELAEKEFGE